MNDSRKKMLDRVRAIMAKTMANGCTEGEAMAALSKARELMQAYDINEHELGHTPEQEGATIYKAEREDPYEIRKWLCVGVAKFTRCRTWRGNSYSVAFCGLESDTVFATWLLETLQQFVLRELKRHQAERRARGLRNPRIVSKSFVIGCAQRIYQRLIELAPVEPKATGLANALTVSRSALITEAMAKAGIHIRNTKRRRTSVDAAAMNAGNNAGNGARFDRPVGQGGTLLLGAA